MGRNHEVFEIEAEKHKEPGRFRHILQQMQRSKGISVQPEKMEEEEDKSLALLIMAMPGRENHGSRACSYMEAVSKATQSFGTPVLVTLDGNSTMSSGMRFTPSTLLCGWSTLLKTCFKTTFDQTVELVQQSWLK